MTLEETWVNKFAALSVISMLLTGVSTGVGAQDLVPKEVEVISPWHIGVGVARNRASISQESIDSVGAAAAPAVLDFMVVEKQDVATGLKLVVGYDVNRYFAVEVGAASFGKPSVEYDYRVGLSSVGFLRTDYKMEALFADAVGILPLGAGWSVLGRGGVSIGRTVVSFDGFPITLIASGDDRRKTKIRAKFGLGAIYEFTPRVSVRGEWERYQLPDPVSTLMGSNKLVKIDSLTASVVYRF